MGPAISQGDDVVHIRGRGPAAPAQWFFPQDHHPESAPGGTVSALMGGWPVIRFPAPRYRFRRPMTGDSFSHGLILTPPRLSVHRFSARGSRFEEWRGGSPGVDGGQRVSAVSILMCLARARLLLNTIFCHSVSAPLHSDSVS